MAAIVKGTNAADSLSGHDVNSSVNGLGGNDVITNFYANATLLGGNGDDTVFNTGPRNKIQTGVGKDFILNGHSDGTLVAHYASIDAGDDNDTIQNAGDFSTLNAGAGNDSVYNVGANTKIFAGEGNDSMDTFGYYVTLDGGDGDNQLYNYGGQNSFIRAGDGNNVIFNGLGVVIYDEDQTRHTVAADYSTITVGGGDNAIANYGAKTKISVGDGDNQITNYGSKVTISGGAGSDSINNGSTFTAGLYLSGEEVYINSGGGNDNIQNSSSKATIRGGTGNDTLKNYSSAFVYEYASGDGADVIEGYTSSSTIKLVGSLNYKTLTSGADAIVSIGSGSITLKDAKTEKLNIVGGSSASAVNTINNSANNKKVSGTSSAEWIVNSGAKVTIQGNGGADTIVGSSNAEMILVASNHGKDVITNFGTNDTLKCTVGSIKSVKKSGEDAIVSLKGASYSTTITLKGAGAYNFKQSGAYLTVNDINVIDNRTRNKTVVGISGRDSIYNYAKNVTINAGDGNDTVQTYGNSVKVEGGDGNDSIKSTGGTGVTLHGGNGNDTLTGSSSAEVFQYRSDGGADVITNFGTNDTLHIAAGKLNSYYSSGNDLIVHAKSTSYQGYITLQGAASKAVKVKVGTGAVQTINNNTFNTLSNTSRYVLVTGTSANDSIYNYAREVTINSGGGNDTVQTYGNYVSVFGGNGNDSIKSTGGSGVTLHGGNGNDTLVGSSSAEVFQYRSDGGNDIITNFGTNDTIKITAGSFQNYYESGADYIVNVKGASYSGTITLKNAKNVGTIKQSGNTIRLIECDPDFDPDTYEEEIKDDFSNPFATPAELVTRGSSQLPSTEEYWFERIDQVEDELNSILSTEDNSITFEINPNDRIKVNALEIVEASARSRNKK